MWHCGAATPAAPHTLPGPVPNRATEAWMPTERLGRTPAARPAAPLKQVGLRRPAIVVADATLRHGCRRLDNRKAGCRGSRSRKASGCHARLKPGRSWWRSVEVAGRCSQGSAMGTKNDAVRFRAARMRTDPRPPPQRPSVARPTAGAATFGANKPRRLSGGRWEPGEPGGE